MRVDTDLTVIIPYSGDYKYLNLCLHIGFSRQSIFPSEVIIVHDNCEFEESPAYLFGMDVSKVKLIKHSTGVKGNRSNVRNVGIREVKTDWILLLDEDVILFPSYFSELQRIVENIPDTNIINGSIVNRKIDMNLPFEEIISMIDKVQITENDRTSKSTVNLNTWMAFRTGNLLVSKRLLFDAGLFDENISGWGEEDTEMGYRAYKAGGQFFGMLCIKAYHLTRDINRRERNKNWAKNLEYTLEKHKGTEYASKRNSSLNFARRYS